MHHDREAKVGRHSVGDVGPGTGGIIGAIESPVILQEKTFGALWVQGDLVNALAELGVFIGHKHGADAAILRGPSRASVVGAVDAASRDGNVNPLLIGGVEDDRVQCEPTVARQPAWAMGMIEESSDQRPCFA